MARFHIRKDGTPGQCHAQPGHCPLGGEGQHYPTMEAAQAAADAQHMDGFISEKPKFGVQAGNYGPKDPQTDAEAIDRLSNTVPNGFESQALASVMEDNERLTSFDQPHEEFVEMMGDSINNLSDDEQDELTDAFQDRPDDFIKYDVSRIDEDSYRQYAEAQYNNAPGSTPAEKFKNAQDAIFKGEAYDEDGNKQTVGEYMNQDGGDTLDIYPDDTKFGDRGQDWKQYADAKGKTPTTQAEAENYIKASVGPKFAPDLTADGIKQADDEYGTGQVREELDKALGGRGTSMDKLTEEQQDELRENPYEYVDVYATPLPDDTLSEVASHTYENAPGKDVNEKYQNAITALHNRNTYDDDGKLQSTYDYENEGTVELSSDDFGYKLNDAGLRLINED